MTFFNNLFAYCDAPRPWGIYFQDSASPQMEALVELHDNIMFYLVITLFGVAWILVSIFRNYVYSKSPISNKYLNHGTLIELIWTITPALILILIAFPSFKLLYLMDEVTDPSLTLFVEGHQWYWSYQYSDFISDDNEEILLSASPSGDSDAYKALFAELINDDPGDVVRPRVDLACERVSAGRHFICDRSQPSGNRLYSLFSGKAYSEHSKDGFTGFIIRNNSAFYNADNILTIRVRFLQPQYDALSSTTDIYSGGTPAAITHAVESSSYTIPSLSIKEG